MQGFTGFTSGASSGFVSNANPYEAHFNSLNNVKPIKLDDEFEAVPIWSIQRRNQNGVNQEQAARARRLAFDWNPKGSAAKFPQRCPSVWVDNFCFLYQRGMEEPYLVLGRWQKRVEVYGEVTDMDVLALAGGGHYERMGNRTRRYDTQTGKYIEFEQGDFSMREAADKEVKEEIGVDPKLIRATRFFGMMDDVFGDPRCHGLRAGIYLRWIEQPPSTSAELKNIVAIPVSQLHLLTERKSKWRFADGKELELGLGHDKLIKLVLAHPDTQAFLTLIRTYYDVQTRNFGNGSAPLAFQ